MCITVVFICYVSKLYFQNLKAQNINFSGTIVVFYFLHYEVNTYFFTKYYCFFTNTFDF